LYTTGYFKNENTNEFGGDMAGVSNPIVTNFVEWPVCRLQTDIGLLNVGLSLLVST